MLNFVTLALILVLVADVAFAATDKLNKTVAAMFGVIVVVMLIASGGVVK